MAQPKLTSRDALVPWIAIGLAALAVVAPFFWLGIPSGHDFEFHMNSWLEVHRQWAQGIFYPRWADLAHYGYGEARFVFYPPLSWLLGAALGTILPWAWVPGVCSWLGLMLSGCTMLLLARRWMSPGNALFAACLYAANPYYIVIVYWRSDFAELLAGAALPLLLLLALRLQEESWRAALSLGLTMAAVWLTNAPAAVLATYSLVLLLAVIAARAKSWRVLVYGGAGIAIGLALAAFYILPAAYEQRWVNIGEVLSAGVRPQDNFLFHKSGDADHDRFNLLVSLIAVGEIVVTAVALFMSRKLRESSKLWTAAAWWGGAGILFMFSFSFPLWNYLPKLRFVQFPWRWLLGVDVVLALLVAMAWRRWWARLVVCGALLGTVFFAWHRIQAPWWDHADDVAEMREAVRTAQGYEGTDEYVPAGADAYDVDMAARRVWLTGPGHAGFRVLRWDAEEKEFTAEVDEATQGALRLFNYPAWKVQVNGKVVTAGTRDAGEMVVTLGPGMNDVRLVFVRTWDRTVGGVISGIVLLGIVGAWGWKKIAPQRRQRALRNAEHG
jgi:hypothetical protein